MKKAKLKYKFVLNTFIFLLIKILLGMQNGEKCLVWACSLMLGGGGSKSNVTTTPKKPLTCGVKTTF